MKTIKTNTSGYMLVDETAEIKVGDKSVLINDGIGPFILTHFEPVENGYEGLRLIASTYKIDGIPLLPPLPDDDKLGSKSLDYADSINDSLPDLYIDNGKTGGSQFDLFPLIRNNWIAGYKAAKSVSGFSEDDLRKAQQAILCNQKDAAMNDNYIIEYLQSLTAKQWEFVPEVEVLHLMNEAGGTITKLIIDKSTNQVKGEWKLITKK